MGCIRRVVRSSKDACEQDLEGWNPRFSFGNESARGRNFVYCSLGTVADFRPVFDTHVSARSDRF